MNARKLTSHASANPRVRQRVLAASALSLFVFGFLVVLGYGRLMLLAILVVTALAAMAGVAAIARRRRPNVRGLGKRAAVRAGALIDRTKSISVGAGRGATQRVRQPARADLSAGTRDRQRALRLNARGTELRRKGDYSGAVESHRAALAIVEQTGDRRGEALTLNSLALAHAAAGEEPAAFANFEQALAILRQLDDREREGHIVANVGFVHLRGGRRQEAAECLRAALENLRPESQEYRRVEAELLRAS
jgi:tetratricopeptide (TPR) repeat protein